MKTEDVELNVKEIFDKKRVTYTSYDIARARWVCRQIIEFLIEWEKGSK